MHHAPLGPNYVHFNVVRRMPCRAGRMPGVLKSPDSINATKLNTFPTNYSHHIQIINYPKNVSYGGKNNRSDSTYNQIRFGSRGFSQVDFMEVFFNIISICFPMNIQNIKGGWWTGVLIIIFVKLSL